MVEAIYNVVPSLPSVPAELQGYAIAVIVFAMVFCPLWRFAKSICDGIDRINAPKQSRDVQKAIGFLNKLGVD